MLTLIYQIKLTVYEIDFLKANYKAHSVLMHAGVINKDQSKIVSISSTKKDLVLQFL